MPRRKNRMLRFALLLLLIAMAGGAIMGIRVHRRSQADAPLKAYIDTLAAAGEPLTLADIEALRPEVPSDQNGALVIERLGPALDACQSDSSQRILLFHKDLKNTDVFTGIPQNTIEPTRQFLSEHQQTLDALDELSLFTTGRMTCSYDFPGPNPLEFKLSPLNHWKRAAQLQRLAAIIDLVDDNTEHAASTIPVQFSIASTLQNEPNLIAALVRSAIVNGGFKTIEMLLRHSEMPDEQLQQLSKLVSAQSELLSFEDGMRAERVVTTMLFDGLAQGTIAPKAMFDSDSLEVHGVPSYVEIRNAQVDAIDRWTRTIELIDDPVNLIATTEGFSHPISVLGIYIPSNVVMAQNTARNSANIRATLTALAAERFRLQHNRFPRSLDELVPQFLNAVPIDPFDGKPLKLAHTDYGMAIYSVASDKTDDNANFTIKKGKYHAPDTGFRLMHPDKRGNLITEE